MAKKDRLEMYNTAIHHAEYCGSQTWQVFGVFSIVHTVFAGAILRENLITTKSSVSVIASVFGVTACILWLATYLRTRGYYKLRMAQARHFEPKSKVGLISKTGYEFSRGKCVVIDGKHYQHT